jgi:hypothetical protein
MKKFLITAVAALALLSIAPFAHAADAPIFPGSFRTAVTHFVEGTDVAGTYKTVFTGGANGSKVLSIIVTNTDTSATHVTTVAYSTSTSDHCATATTCAFLQSYGMSLGAGLLDDVGATEFLGEGISGLPSDSDGERYIFVTDETNTLEMTFATALTASSKISVTVIAVDF